ncbi:gamma-glutamylcyclotransferase [Dolichospermum flos-aquae]|uniref:gamma-glutamylcyclotransferase n=1 Tax=Dolichospermum flosaquae TaxID=1166 RepID=UPI002D801775|nr:gamma-glutamylcyclotransferase [Dolichospermum flos-aquae]
MINVFVYGTLKPGEVNYQKYCAGKVIKEQRAIANGKLNNSPMVYPAITSEDGSVTTCVD